MTEATKMKATEAEAEAAPGADLGSTLADQPNERSATTTSETSSATAVPAGEKSIAEPTAAAAPVNPEDTRTSLQTAIIMLSLCASVFLAALDITIITTALPTISEYFQSDSGYTWVGSGFLLAQAASVPSWGKISDIFGRKPVILLATAIFFVGSLLAAVSVSIGMLIAARAVQGVGAGGLVILTNICISDLFSMRNRGKYYGIVGMVWAVASGVGPILGGVFTEKVTWRWCFYINLPITGVVFVALVLFLKLENPRTPVWEGLRAIDWLGSLFIVGGTLMLLLGLELGGVTYPWSSPTVVCLIVFGVVTWGIFIAYEARFARYPVMPLRLFTSRPNLAALGACFCHGFVFIAGSYYLPLYFQAVLSASPLLSGVYLLPFVMVLSLASGLVGVYIKKTGKYLPPILTGFAFTVLGFGLFTNLGATPNWAKIIIYQAIAGLGTGPNFQAPLIALQSNVAPRDIATATATFGFVRTLATSISVVIGGVVFQNRMAAHYADLLPVLGPQLAAQLSGASAGASVGIVAALPPTQQSAVQQAFAESLQSMWIVYVSFAALGLLIACAIGTRKLSETHAVVKTGLQAEEQHRQEAAEEKRRKSSAVLGGAPLEEGKGEGVKA